MHSETDPTRPLPPTARLRVLRLRHEPGRLEYGPHGLPIVSLERPLRLAANPEARFPPGRVRALLRLTVGRDFRGAARIEVRLGGVAIGVLEALVAAPWASLALDLAPALGPDPPAWPRPLELELAAEPFESGLGASLRPGNRTPVLAADSSLGPELALVPLEPVVAPLRRALAEYVGREADYLGWMVGCTTTGLALLAGASGRAALWPRLARRLAGRGEGLPLEGSPRRPGALEPTDPGNHGGLESFAPVAGLALLERREPNPERRRRLAALARRMLEVAGSEPAQLTTEGCFTLAHPLAAAGRALGEPALQTAAREVVERRWAVLESGGTVAQRATADGERRFMVDWARGTAWLALGTALTALELPQGRDRDGLAARLAALAPVLLGRQRPDGLWDVFTSRPGSGPETSGSAGIAAALALASREGWLGSEGRAAAERALAALEPHLEPDGCLGGVSQHNPAGEEGLQLRHRVRADWGTGLLAALAGALLPQNSTG